MDELLGGRFIKLCTQSGTAYNHALLMDFFRKEDESGAEHAMAIHLHHALAVLGLAEKAQSAD